MFDLFRKLFKSVKNPQYPISSILIIEDSPADRLFIQRILEKRRFSVFTASNGETGLDIVYHNKIDLIILDYIMPNLDGLKIGNILKQDYRTKNIPIIFLTVVESSEAILGCYEFSAVYLHKPVGAKELLRQIESLLASANNKDQVDRI